MMMIFSSMKNDSFDVNYASSEYLSSHAATLPKKILLQERKLSFMIHSNLILWFHNPIGIVHRKKCLQRNLQ